MTKVQAIWLKGKEIKDFESIMEFYLDFIDGEKSQADLLAEKLLGKIKRKKMKKTKAKK